MAITRDAEQDTHFDPSACVEVVVSNRMGLDGLDWWCSMGWIGVDFPRNPQMVARKAVLIWEIFGFVLGGPRPSNIEVF